MAKKKEYFVFLPLYRSDDRLAFPCKDLSWAIKNCSYSSQHLPNKKSAYVLALVNGFDKLVVRMATYRGI